MGMSPWGTGGILLAVGGAVTMVGGNQIVPGLANHAMIGGIGMAVGTGMYVLDSVLGSYSPK